MGGINSGGIKLAFDTEGIPQDERGIMLQKIITYISKSLEKQQEGK